ncbi:Bifunctional purine biosynthetic protein ade1 [Pichia californica]|uniref:Bifunctional purine biosynthetic protein ade1 n=1 Tax=Pichia californica TaxID=460514 RepID=A0A9P7BES9_9ASCO|nr:Bifunctional purine biosynthetic protein ade1 [[Candida] californica]KAG0687395.1 Bifunctional purine biosynthetic protein ade1 [[Candida] californica]
MAGKINILVIGNGGREHALVWKLSQSPLAGEIFVAPGNGGIAIMENVKTVPIGSSPENFPELVKFAVEKKIGLVVPGPEQPLVDGISDAFKAVGIPVFGPSSAAARMEGSKAFSKDFMKEYNIPTASYENFTEYEKAKEYVLNAKTRLVIKASGIAAGKGVLIPETTEEALAAIKEIMVDRAFGSAGDEVVIEEYLEGDELSILCVSDGYSYAYFPPAQDHKRIGDGDAGLNTGGMGAYAPAPLATNSLLAKIESTILKPSIDGMRKAGYPMVGCLFVGVMVSPSGEPKVLEYNVRFGDPETQTVLPLLKSDLLEIFMATVEHRLDAVDFEIYSGKSSTTVVMAAAGYPESYKKGDIITVDSALPENTYIFHAGTKLENGNIVTAGGRVIAATAIADSLEDAVKKAYVGVDHVSFEGKYNRKDIAYRAFKNNTAKKVSITYEDAGVSVDAGNQLVENIKKMVKSTARPGADSEIGGFGGLFELKKAGFDDIDQTVLVAATDGVGTKLRIAQIMNIHNTVGIDLVAMNVNDLVVQGAEPLMFLDYFATGHLDINVAAQFVEGVANGCKLAGCALVGGETSEMPGMYEPGHYDTNGTAVGAVLKNQILPKFDEMKKGDILLGIASDGVHSNGFSLVRKIITSTEFEYTDSAPWKPSKTIGEEVLIPTRIYVKQLLPSTRANLILGLSHITGGGLIENVPRALPKHLAAVIDMNTWEVPAIFKWLGKTGGVPINDILKTLNLGVGMVVIVKAENVEQVTKNLEKEGETVYKIGELVERKGDEPACVVLNANADNLY